MKKTKNDIAWEKLFEKHKIIKSIGDRGQFTILASEINKYREARLMTKFDHRSNLPEVFADNKLSILPLSRGEYMIAPFNAYKEFEQEAELPPVGYFNFPENIQSIDFEKITSEAISINCAYISGILSDFFEEEALLPTVNGRMSSSSFDFKIKGILDNSKLLNLNISNSQIEIDGGFEGNRSLSLIEAKNSISSDFLIRQLYYPFRLWNGKISKEIKSIFLTYSNGIFDLFEYKFEDPEYYNSLVLVKRKRYSLEEKDISLNEIQNILRSVKTVEEPKLPFPQADSFERVINLCELLHERVELTKDEVTSTYDFDKRQTDYYINAGRYLGLIEMVDKKVVLTQEGRSLFQLKYKTRQLKLVELILRHQVFSSSMSLCLKMAELPSKSDVVMIMQSLNLYNVSSETTYYRRASTILGWVDWMLSLQNN